MQVFETSSLAGIRMKNRILRSATYECMCDAWAIPSLPITNSTKRYQLGERGPLSPATWPSIEQAECPRFMGIIDDDTYIEEFGKLSTIVHANDTPIIMQIAHCGGLSNKG